MPTLKPHNVNKIRGPIVKARDHGARMMDRLKDVRVIMTELNLGTGQINQVIKSLRIAQAELNYLDNYIINLDENKQTEA